MMAETLTQHPTRGGGGRLSLRGALESGEFAITAEIMPPKGPDLERFLNKAHELWPWVHAINLTDCSRAVLRMASYELMVRSDVPYKVIINESVNLTKKFGAEQAYKYVNGVLDQTARRLRAVEYPQGHGSRNLLKK